MATLARSVSFATSFTPFLAYNCCSGAGSARRDRLLACPRGAKMSQHPRICPGTAGCCGLPSTAPKSATPSRASCARRLADELERAADDPTIGAILLTGKRESLLRRHGSRRSLQPMPSAESTASRSGFSPSARGLPKPIVAAVAGAALGGGTGLVANCHVVVAGEDATFGLTEIRLGPVAFPGFPRRGRRSGGTPRRSNWPSPAAFSTRRRPLNWV